MAVIEPALRGFQRDRISLKSMILMPVIAISVLSIAYIMSFELIVKFMLQQGDISRYVLSILLIMPLGFCMGMPFPMALARLSQTQPQLIPWAWGINGCASVISAILATLIAMQFGFSVLVALAVVIYGVAVCFFPNSENAFPVITCRCNKLSRINFMAPRFDEVIRGKHFLS